VGSVVLPLTLGVFSVSGNYLLSLAMLLGVGYAMISVNATINTIIQTNVPDELRGRVNGLYSLLFVGMAPLGNLQAGLLSDWFGAPTSLFIGSVITGLFVVFMLVRKRTVFSLS
jgi:MFS family permease